MNVCNEKRFDRDELASMVAAECNQLADKWWFDREAYHYAAKHDLFWEEPRIWCNESRPPVRACGAALARLLTGYEPGENGLLIEFLEWCYGRHVSHHKAGELDLSHGFYRASKAVRERTGFGYPDPDPVIESETV